MKILKRLIALFNKDRQCTDLSFSAFMESPIASLVLDNNGIVLQANHSFFELYGYNNMEILNDKLSLLKSGKHEDTFYKNLWERFMELDKHSFEIWNKCKNNTIILIKEHVTRFQNNGKEYFIVTHENITEQKKLSDHHRYLATHDHLTGLANRVLLDDRFSQACLNALRVGKKMNIILCDLNEFKQINDTFGHQFGDIVLQEVANKLRKLVRDNDTVSRYGGDEFMIILEQMDNIDDVEIVVNKIKSTFPISLEIAGFLCDVSMSIGHACFPDEGTNFEQLTNMADAKMYEAKNSYYGY